MLGHGGSSASSYLADPTSPIPSHCAVIILFQSVPVHQLSRLAPQELKDLVNKGIYNVCGHYCAQLPGFGNHCLLASGFELMQICF